MMSSLPRERGSANSSHREPAPVRQKHSLLRLYALARQHIQEAEFKQEKDLCDYTVEIRGTDECSSSTLDHEPTQSKAAAGPFHSTNVPPTNLRILQYVMDLAESSTSKLSCGIPCQADVRNADSNLQRIVDEIPLPMDMTQSLESAPTDESTLDASLLKRFQWSLPSTKEDNDAEDDDDDEQDEDTLFSFATDSLGPMDGEFF